MRDISLNDKPNALPRHTFLNYGDTRSGKTVFGATFPRPLVIADIVERGYESIRSMDRSWWFEPGVEPIVMGVENMGDMAQMQPKIDALIACNRVMSIVVDAFSFYCDFFLNALIKLQTKPDNRQAYGSLGLHLRELRTSLHSKPVNVMWNCLAKHPETEDPKGGPLIPGQQASKFAGAVDFLMYSRIEQVREAGKIVNQWHEIRTRQYGTYMAGSRLGTSSDMMPDPFYGTYSDFIACLGYDIDAVRAALPAIKPMAPVAVMSAKPPIAKGSAPAVAKAYAGPPRLPTNPAPKVAIPPQASNQQQAPRGATK